MKLRVVSSGSHGNCYILEDKAGRRLILDAGVRYDEIMQAVRFDIDSIDGCLVTHEHMDHAKAAADLLANSVDVAMSRGTADSVLDEDDYLRNMITFCRAGDQFRLGDWSVMAFDTEHDAAEPLGFLILNKTEKILYLTDSSFCKYKFVGLTAIIVECNYILDIINGNIATGVKASTQQKRVLATHAGLETITPWLQSFDRKWLNKIVLVHLSAANSDAARMKSEVERATGIDTVIADAGQVVDLTGIGF